MPSRATALDSAIKPEQRTWLAEYVCDKLEALFPSMAGWRTKVAKYERRMDEDYSDRESQSDKETEDFGTVFSKQNDTLGMVAGFVDYAYAQAKDDILGDDDWLAVSPVGASDTKLADQIRKHAPWKLEKNGALPPLYDGIRLTPNLGTAFLKVAYEEIPETFEKSKPVIYHKRKPVTLPDGRLVLGPLVPAKTAEALPANPGDGSILAIGKKALNTILPGKRRVSPEGHPEMVFPADEVEEVDSFVEETVIVKSGVSIRPIDFNDITFDITAPALDLLHTPVFHRFKIGLLDARRLYDLDDVMFQQAQDLAQARELTGGETAREQRDESAPLSDPQYQQSNPEIVLFEGFLRCDPLNTGSNVRIYVVFSPETRKVFHMDYLHNVTPGGKLPIFPLRWWRIPNRITGKGYWEVFEKDNDAIDKLHSSVIWRDRFSNQPVAGYNRNALVDPSACDGPMDLTKPVELAEGKTIADFLSFTAFPDNNSRSIEILNQKLQMGQMRTGITSAAQGELKGVPSANTATGTRDLSSRGAVILKWPISDLREDVEQAVAYAVELIYENQDTDETFSWGEGDARELIELKSAQVRNLAVDVTFRLSQTQNLEIRQNSEAAVGHIASYLMVPEQEKAAVRPIYVQILSCLGFRNAEQAIREPMAMPDPVAVDPATGLPAPPQQSVNMEPPPAP